jgi:hypothetical protein
MSTALITAKNAENTKEKESNDFLCPCLSLHYLRSLRLKSMESEFEQRLRRQPLKEIPPAWRADILTATRAAQAPRHASRITHHSWLSTFNSQLSTLFWPHPKAWAGLAAIWICIFAVFFSMRDSSPRMTAKSVPSSPEVMVELKKQQRMFAELVGSYEPADVDRQKIYSPKPRSGRVEILVA